MNGDNASVFSRESTPNRDYDNTPTWACDLWKAGETVCQYTYCERCITLSNTNNAYYGNDPPNRVCMTHNLPCTFCKRWCCRQKCSVRTSIPGAHEQTYVCCLDCDRKNGAPGRQNYDNTNLQFVFLI